jgi:hypothetical protein
MIDRAALPSISNILSWLDIPAGRRGRTRCPIHCGDNSQAFSYDDEQGVWFCHRCGIGGDAVELVKKSLDTDFQGALKWLGIESSKSLQQNSKPIQKSNRRGPWLHLLELQRVLHKELHLRIRIERFGLKHFRENSQNPIAWELLATAYSGRPMNAIEHRLDLLLEEIPREAYPRAEELPGYALSQLIQRSRRKAA